MKKFLIAATAAVIGTLSFASVSEAGWRHHHRHHGHFGIVVDLGPRYIVDAYPTCFVKKTVRFDRWGNRYVKKVKYCN